jgi:hypothetical protein
MTSRVPHGVQSWELEERPRFGNLPTKHGGHCVDKEVSKIVKTV